MRRTIGNNSDHSRTAILSARGVAKVYPMGEVEVHALTGVDLDVETGEMVVILGPSGSGKSTLLNIIGGLDVPTDGTLTFKNQKMDEMSERAQTRFRREHVGFVFQFYNLIPSLTARENVALAAELAEDPMDPGEALEYVGLGERMDHFPSQLSGGQQQRIAIARAFVKRPELLLCDEPTGALDVETGRIVLEVLRHANRELGATTVIITHNAAIGAMADRVVKIGDGRIGEIARNDEPAAPEEISW